MSRPNSQARPLDSQMLFYGGGETPRLDAASRLLKVLSAAEAFRHNLLQA